MHIRLEGDAQPRRKESTNFARGGTGAELPTLSLWLAPWVVRFYVRPAGCTHGWTYLTRVPRAEHLAGAELAVQVLQPCAINMTT